MNRINHLFQTKTGGILSVFFTAGYPSFHSTVEIIKALDQAGADMIEIGIPFSDPMADGLVIQKSSDLALKQGMSLVKLFGQLKDIRRETAVPLLLMGYLNPVMQFGLERFCEECAVTGIDGVILPDMPFDIFRNDSQLLLPPSEKRSIYDLFSQHDLHNIFLVSPQTPEIRIRTIDSNSDAFIYLVSASSTTGVKGVFNAHQIAYFERIREMKLRNPGLIGFGISDHESFTSACQFAKGAIIGSAFVKMLGTAGDMGAGIRKFVKDIRGNGEERSIEN